jgi:hypothetical protein
MRNELQQCKALGDAPEPARAETGTRHCMRAFFKRLLLCGGHLASRQFQQARLDALQQARDSQPALGKVNLDDIKIACKGLMVYQAPNRQLQAVVAALKDGDEHVMILGGPAMGKSSLAREVERQVLENQVRIPNPSLYPIVVSLCNL